MAAVGDHRKLHARRAAVVEQRLDSGADRASRVEDVVNEDARHPLERELERRRANDRLCVERRLAGANLDVVSVEGDVELAERELDTCALFDQPAETLRQRDTAAVDADERNLV